MIEAFIAQLSDLSKNTLVVALGFDCVIGKECLIEKIIRLYE